MTRDCEVSPESDHPPFLLALECGLPATGLLCGQQVDGSGRCHKVYKRASLRAVCKLAFLFAKEAILGQGREIEVPEDNGNAVRFVRDHTTKLIQLASPISAFTCAEVAIVGSVSV